MRLLIASLAVLLVTGACSSGSESVPQNSAEGGDGDAAVSITAVDNSFEPTDLDLPAGEEVTVEFTNTGDNPHTFTSEAMGFDSGTVEPGASAEVTFTVPEEDTPFICLIHESDDMVGTIVPSS